MAGRPQRAYTIDDYRRIEAASPIRHEFHRGEIFAMAGGSLAHNHISANVLSLLRTGLAGTPCSAFGSDMRLSAPAGLLTYPDAMVICGPVELVPGREDEVTNPTLLVEVLSDATRQYDRGDKFRLYQSIASFREYLLIEQRRVRVEQLVRAGGGWQSQLHERLDAQVQLVAVDVALPVRAMYDRVFPSADAGG
jgi:Uma2 family endonuclease